MAPRLFASMAFDTDDVRAESGSITVGGLALILSPVTPDAADALAFAAAQVAERMRAAAQLPAEDEVERARRLTPHVAGASR